VKQSAKSLRMDMVRFLPLFAALLPLTLLLGWLQVPGAEGAAFQRSGINLLLFDRNVLQMLPLAIAAGLALAFGLACAAKASRTPIFGLVTAFSAAIVCAIYALLSAKDTADASLLLPAPFLVRHLQLGFWLFLLVALIGLIISLLALKQPSTYVILTAMAVVWLLPIIWLVITSFRSEPGAYTPYIIPKGWTTDNYTRLFTETTQFNFPQWYTNTLFVAVITCALTTMMVLMISYTFSRLRFPSRKALMNMGLVIAMFPGFMSMIAVYHILKAIGLAKSLVSLILVYTGGGILTYTIAKGFFDTIPKSLDEAATGDGATENMVFWRIILPSSKPIVVFTAITAFIAPWVDFIFVSVIMKDEYANYTVALGLFRMLEREHIYEYFTRFCAGAVLVAIPITLLFIKIQKFYVEGVTGGAVKG
jgi:arabinogalactan oligomer / maltooligosaccharide transport system permease protein